MSEQPPSPEHATETVAAPAPAASAPAEIPPPAELVPQPTRRERFVWYAASMLLSLLLVCAGLRLDRQDFRAPFYYDTDALLYLPLAKNIIENGTHWHNDRVGAPGRQELYDFPIIDYLHFGCLWVLSRFTSDVLIAYNLYNLLTYPLTVLTGMIVLRWLKLSLPAAAVCALLYTFLPYHQERYQYHYFLAAYWWVPVSLVPALAICKGDFPLYPRSRDNPETRERKFVSVAAALPLALGIVTAAAGAYYAFFACAIYAFVGLYSSVMFRTWRGVTCAVWITAPVVATGVAFHYPTIVYHARYGTNPITDRLPEEAELYGLKLTHLLLPANDHNLSLFSRWRAMYSSPHRPADGESAGSLGIVGGIGFLALLTLAIFPRRRRWPEAPFAAVVLFLVLLATVGGFGSLYNFLVSPQIRAYNRISVFIGFLSLFMVFWWIDRFLHTRTERRSQRWRYPAFAALFFVGFLDQTPFSWFKNKVIVVTDSHAERFRADRRFFQKIEEASPGARVFCLPYMAYPENPQLQKMPNYEHARGYFFTQTVSWSFGAIKRREADTWQREVAFEKPDEFLRRIVANGFDGVFIDTRGFPPRKADPNKSEPSTLVNPVERFHAIYGDLIRQNAARLPEILHEDGKQVFLDLRPYRDAYQRIVGPDAFAAQTAAERDYIAALWLKGFWVLDPVDTISQVYWGTQDSRLVFVNPTDRVRRIDFSFTVGAEAGGEFRFLLSGIPGLPAELSDFTVARVWNDATNDGSRGIETKVFTGIELPPGRTTLRIRCITPPSFVPSDHRRLCFYIADFKMVEK